MNHTLARLTSCIASSLKACGRAEGSGATKKVMKKKTDIPSLKFTLPILETQRCSKTRRSSYKHVKFREIRFYLFLTRKNYLEIDGFLDSFCMSKINKIYFLPKS